MMAGLLGVCEALLGVCELALKARARGARRESLEPVGLAVKLRQRQRRRLLAVHAVDRGVLGVAALVGGGSGKDRGTGQDGRRARAGQVRFRAQGRLLLPRPLGGRDAREPRRTVARRPRLLLEGEALKDQLLGHVRFGRDILQPPESSAGRSGGR
jgi:hypothetical protein